MALSPVHPEHPPDCVSLGNNHFFLQVLFPQLHGLQLRSHAAALGGHAQDRASAVAGGPGTGTEGQGPQRWTFSTNGKQGTALGFTMTLVVAKLRVLKK